MADVVGDLVYEAAIDSGKFDAGLAKLENNAKKAANNVDKAAQKVAAPVSYTHLTLPTT